MIDAERLLASRRRVLADLPPAPPKRVCEGGCGVLGYIATAPTSGRYLDRPLTQMHNRGNGKGGGVAALGCFGDRRDLYAVQVGYLDHGTSGRLDQEIRTTYLDPTYEIVDREEHANLDDPRAAGLELAPPRIVRYFCRVKESARRAYQEESGVADLDKAEEEVVYRTSFRINSDHYAIDAPRALVLSHARDLAIFKGVGYAEQVLRYYRLEELEAHGWIGHQRYPTRGRVWHPGGAHPFIGLDEALVHNGDFANYYSVARYLEQHGVRPLFTTDTEVAVLLFDLLTRVYEYPLEHVIETLAPTSELDFLRLAKPKQRVYQALRACHLHGSPDGPWFFIIARNQRGLGALELIGITDTSMLRPQVFALCQGRVGLGAVASEKQAIDAVLEDLAHDVEGLCPVADRYWNARGGSSTDGGAFVFRVAPGDDGEMRLTTVDKFGRPVTASGLADRNGTGRRRKDDGGPTAAELVASLATTGGEVETYRTIAASIAGADYAAVRAMASTLVEAGGTSDAERAVALEILTLLRDRHYDPGGKARSSLLAIWDQSIRALFRAVEPLGAGGSGAWRRVDHGGRSGLRPPRAAEKYLVIDARAFPPEGPESVARLLADARMAGWTRFFVHDTTGDRFLGSGLGSKTAGIRIDVYGSPGDYLGSSLDGAEIHVHADGQDQIGQIMRSGLIVVHGSVGQTLLYGAKGGRVLVRGNAGGRALINAVGRIQAVINGTCLDYAAESFMAGRATGDGFLLINGLEFDDRGNAIGMELKYPGSTFFSLASGGAGYLNDPYQTVSARQLNGARFEAFTEDDWRHIEPVLRANEACFGISVEDDLQTVDGIFHWPQDIYRKVVAETAA